MFVDLVPRSPSPLHARSRITRTFRKNGNVWQIYRYRWTLIVRSGVLAENRDFPFFFNFDYFRSIEIPRVQKLFSFFERNCTDATQPLALRLSRSLRKSRHVDYEVRCASRYLVGIYVCHDSLLLGSQLIRIRLEPATGNSQKLSLKHTVLPNVKFSTLNFTVPSSRRNRRAVWVWSRISTLNITALCYLLIHSKNLHVNIYLDGRITRMNCRANFDHYSSAKIAMLSS